MIVASWPLRSRVRMTFAPAFPPPAIRTYISGPASRAGGCRGRERQARGSTRSQPRLAALARTRVASGAARSRARRRQVRLVGPLNRRLRALRNHTRAHRVAQRVDGGGRRADRAEAARGVELRPRRIEDSHHGALDPEPLLCDLPDDKVGVVAVGADDDGVSVLDPGLPEHGRVHAVTDDEPAGPVLSEAVEGGLLLVDSRHVPPFGGKTLRDRRAHPAAADDDELHKLSVALRSTRGPLAVTFKGRPAASLAMPPKGRASFARTTV